MRNYLGFVFPSILVFSISFPACGGGSSDPAREADSIEHVTQPLTYSTGCREMMTADQIAVYIDNNAQGSCALLGINDDVGHGKAHYPNPAAFGLPNDSITSVYVGNNVSVLAYQDISYQNWSASIAGNVDYLGSYGWNDRISSMTIVPRSGCGSADPTQACFYGNANFDDGVGPDVVNGIGSYPTVDSMGIKNDSLSSMRVGSAINVKICKDVSFGNCITLGSGDYSYLGTLGYNDVVSSFQVLGSCRSACGGQSLAGCFCDAACAGYGDCCSDKALLCGS